MDGYGETCPLGSTYLAAHAEGARAALRELAPAVIGADPAGVRACSATAWTPCSTGHEYAKSAIDVACWDAAGEGARRLGDDAARRPAATSRFRSTWPSRWARPAEMADHAAALRAEGITRFQLKVGDDPRVDADRVAGRCSACAGPTTSSSPMRTAATRRRRAWSPSACWPGSTASTSSSRARRSRRAGTCASTPTLPFVLDECVHDVPSLVRAHDARALEAFNLKISKVGGLTKARQMRDLADALGLSGDDRGHVGRRSRDGRRGRTWRRARVRRTCSRCRS